MGLRGLLPVNSGVGNGSCLTTRVAGCGQGGCVEGEAIKRFPSVGEQRVEYADSPTENARNDRHPLSVFGDQTTTNNSLLAEIINMSKYGGFNRRKF